MLVFRVETLSLTNTLMKTSVPFVAADSSSVLVRKEAAHLMTFLLYSLALKHLTSNADKHSTEYGLLANFIESLQSKEGEPLWPRERPTLNNPFIPSTSMVAAFVNKGTVNGCNYYCQFL